MEFSGDDDDDVRGYFPVRGRKVDYVWDGWNVHNTYSLKSEKRVVMIQDK